MPMSSSSFPSLSQEQQLFDAGYSYVVGIDEVGRGALAGPVSVGLAVVSKQQLQLRPTWPAKLRDSKLISEAKRTELYAPVCEWVERFAVGSATAQEIDEHGIIWALSAAAHRATKNFEQPWPEGNGVVLLDGSHNWLGETFRGLPVVVRVKADRDCVVVAAASVIAKVTRDNYMISLAVSESDLESFDFAGNKGYSSPSHLRALRGLGPSQHHRQTWLSKILPTDTLF